MPLADKVRPDSLDNFVGQTHILGKGKLLRKIIESGHIPNLILYGPPGTGKTTLAYIISKMTNRNYMKFNATNVGVKEVREAIENSQKIDFNYNPKGTIIMIDEIQQWSKKQHQALISFAEESTDITFIMATADNPYFVIYKALISRSTVMEFKPHTKDDITKALNRAVSILSSDDYKNKEITVEDGALEYIGEVAGGDLRIALNTLENLFSYCYDKEINNLNISLEAAIECCTVKILNYDKDGDSHYDTLSAFHKSLRSSDSDAAMHYLARLIKAGDIQGISRRLLCVASEDVGLAYSQAAVITKSCIDSALQLGFPEAGLPLAHATLLLANSPKSDSVTKALFSALNDLDTIDVGEIPPYLKDGHYEGAVKLGHAIGYKYAHDYPNHYVEQQRLPNNIKDKKYYIPCDNKTERTMAEYWNKIKK